MMLTSEKEQIQEKVETFLETDSIYYFTLKDGSKNRIDLEKEQLIRETDEALLKFFFQEGVCHIDLKKENLSLDLPLQVSLKQFEQEKIEVLYFLNEEKYHFKLEGEFSEYN